MLRHATCCSSGIHSTVVCCPRSRPPLLYAFMRLVWVWVARLGPPSHRNGCTVSHGFYIPCTCQTDLLTAMYLRIIFSRRSFTGMRLWHTCRHALPLCAFAAICYDDHDRGEMFVVSQCGHMLCRDAARLVALAAIKCGQPLSPKPSLGRQLVHASNAMLFHAFHTRGACR